jgi:hypothetical protein
MTEDHLEQEVLGWLADVGYTPLDGPDLAPDGSSPERGHYREVVLEGRLRSAIARLNPAIPAAAREDALARCSIWARRRCWRRTGSFTGCSSAACRSSTSRRATPAVTSCG